MHDPISRRSPVLPLLLCLALAACGSASDAGDPSGGTGPTPIARETPSPVPSPGERLVWGDEFDGEAGTPVDPARWRAQLGGSGFGHGLLDYKTNCTDPIAPHFTTANAAADGNGNLVIRAQREPVPYDTCWYGPCEFTSALLVTDGTFRRRFGRFEIRMKVPRGRGLWPAFWMYGETADGLWGEIDLFEGNGQYPDRIFQAAHGPGFTGERIAAVTGMNDLDADYHTYVLDWSPGSLVYLVDGEERVTITPRSLPRDATWPFDDIDVFLVLDLSLGSRESWSGAVDDRTPFPADLLVDYVRVYAND